MSTAWDIDSIRGALSRNDTATEGIPLSLINEVDVVGVGSTSKTLTLLLPPDRAASPIDGKRLAYQPAVDVFLPELQREVCAGIVLISRRNLDSGDMELLSLVVASLVQIAWGAGGDVSMGESITALSRFFENHFVESVGIDVVTGLFGELFLIANSKSPNDLISAWHEHASDSYDFRWGSDLIEVKSSIRPARHHHFSSTQIPPAPGLELQVVSVILDQSSTGISIRDLVAEISLKIDPHSQRKLNRVVIETLGVPAELANQFTFGTEEFNSSVRFYDWREVPCPSRDERILSMNWVVDLARVPSTTPMSRLNLLS
jgi:Putative  PD-(D/E)XK family member, (DUF4420)